MLRTKIRSMFNMIRAVMRRPEIVRSKVFVMTFDNSYSCNPAAIADELLATGKDIDIVWAVTDKTDKSLFPEGVRTVNRGSREMFTEMRSARIWLDNGLNCVWYYMPKRKGQIYINTWHGSLGIKRLGGNISWRMRAKTCRRKTDYMISNSRFEEEVFASTYWKGVPCLRYGHARNSVLCDEAKFPETATRVRKTLGIYDGRRILLYAPTFRDSGKDFPKPEWDKVTAALKERFGGDWIITSRLHMKDRDKSLSSVENVIDVSAYPSIADLMIAADVAVTDYSSWIYDYILTGKPGFVFAPDKDEYEKSRGLYYPLSDTPFDISVDTDGLCSGIRGFDAQDYNNRVRAFLEDKECCDDADAAKRAAQFIMDKCSDIV